MHACCRVHPKQLAAAWRMAHKSALGACAERGALGGMTACSWGAHVPWLVQALNKIVEKHEGNGTLSAPEYEAILDALIGAHATGIPEHLRPDGHADIGDVLVQVWKRWRLLVTEGGACMAAAGVDGAWYCLEGSACMAVHGPARFQGVVFSQHVHACNSSLLPVRSKPCSCECGLHAVRPMRLSRAVACHMAGAEV